MRKVFFASFDGCYANEADGELIREFLDANGFDVVAEPGSADLLVYNTCAFDRQAEDKSLAVIDSLRTAARPGVDLLVTGCLPGINPERLEGRGVGRTVTPQTMDALDEMVGATVPLSEVRARHTAHREKCLITIATGCLGTCTFCGIKNAIGSVRSRSLSDILAEFDRHRQAGRTRFVLALHDFGAYGRDLGLDAIDLLRAVVARPGDFKVEIEWIDPRWLLLMLDGFIEMLQTGKLVKYFAGFKGSSQHVLTGVRVAVR